MTKRNFDYSLKSFDYLLIISAEFSKLITICIVQIVQKFDLRTV